MLVLVDIFVSHTIVMVVQHLFLTLTVIPHVGEDQKVISSEVVVLGEEVKSSRSDSHTPTLYR